jgi:hypothetical protein
MSPVQSRLRILVAAVVSVGLVVLLVAAAPRQRPAPAPAHPATHQPAQMPAPAQPNNMRGLTPAQMAAQGAMQGRMNSPSMMSPAMSSPYQSSPGYQMPYGMGGMGSGSGYGGSGMSNYGGQRSPTMEDGSQVGAAEVQKPQESAEDRTLSRVLTAAGLPTEGGQIVWPLGLRILPGPRAAELRQQIEAIIDLEAEQSAAGSVNARLAQEATSAVDALRKALLRDREERFSLTATAYEDAEAFLGKLKHAETLLAGGLGPQDGTVRLEAGKEKVAQVALRDNRFDPRTLTVSVGTTVRWTN